MYSELECGICYRIYNAGRRCPRELQCKHSFCQSCLLALSRPLGPDEADRSILCPLCRHTTSISGEGKVRAELRVDEGILERLVAAGVLDEEEDDPEEEEAAHVQDGCDDDSSEEATPPETPAEESEASEGSRGERVRRCWRKVWQKISGKRSRQRSGENCITGDDMRNLAMMSCYMF
uniref:E3 ubiquitin-protein ligase-like n=1 Tax=Scatophagus argus TaxID=75038 RepID=UPI001ED82FCF|nr:E3 ubiquitin-protein ligase-like [Scatophagus argus]